WAIVVILSFLVLDIAVFAYTARVLTSGADSVLGELEVRNTYVGLEELYAEGVVKSSRYEPLINRPRVIAQVTSVEPNKIYPVDQLRKLSDVGRLSPPDFHLQVSPNTSTISQFRVLDFGMERCQLAIRLPAANATLEYPFAFQSGAEGDVRLDICKLQTDPKRPLDARKLSWRSKPRCAKKVGTLVVRPGAEATLAEFSCRWGEHHAFEVTCADPECLLDVRGTQFEPWGVFMYQHQTV
ncbi:hypothetical protein K474DRAFT_1596395, partial [Panus rudis PR-1116 ss-1]